MIFYNDLYLGLGLFILWNLAGFVMMLVDKRLARKNARRIRERTLFLWAVVFGATGIILGMYMFRHKTRHWTFVAGMPIIWLFNLLCGYLLWR